MAGQRGGALSAEMLRGGADLHLHSRHSDGTFEPSGLVCRAAEEGLEAVSLTDHDTVSGTHEALEEGRRRGVRVLTGVEISAEYAGHEIHLLGYGFDPEDPALLAMVERRRAARERRAEQMVSRLNELGVPLRMEMVRESAGGAILGRPHLAEALVRERLAGSLQAAFLKYLVPGCSAYLPSPRPSLDAARSVMAGAGGVLVLAHPHLSLSSDKIRRLAGEGIDGLETEHPRLKPSQCRELSDLARERTLLATGGSDCHGPRRGPVRLGSVRIPMETVERVEAAAAAIHARRRSAADQAPQGGIP
jgi:3',5'-nucleoside bisphosphate phosphatase